VQQETLEPLQLRAAVDSNGVRRKGAPKDRVRAKVSSFYFSDAIPAVTPVELAAAHHDGAAHEALAATSAPPEWDRQLHGGADERAETDAYAPHAHEDGQAREADPEAETTSTR
jgi:ubiquinol-cytochrome c reductase cytochrome b subunit